MIFRKIHHTDLKCEKSNDSKEKNIKKTLSILLVTILAMSVFPVCAVAARPNVGVYICSPYGNSKADFNFALDNKNFRPGKYYYNKVKYLQERISGADFPDTYEEYPEDMISPEEYDEIISFCKTGIEWSEYDAEDYESAKEEDIRHLNPGDRFVQGKKYAVEVVVEPTIYRELVPCLKNAAKNN